MASGSRQFVPLLAGLAMALTANVASAAPGDRDTDFASDGLFTMDVRGGQEFAYDMAVDWTGGSSWPAPRTGAATRTCS